MPNERVQIGAKIKIFVVQFQVAHDFIFVEMSKQYPVQFVAGSTVFSGTATLVAGKSYWTKTNASLPTCLLLIDQMGRHDHVVGPFEHEQVFGL